MKKFTGKVAVITGSAKGIGKAVAEKFAFLGAKTAILDFDEVVGIKTAEAISKEYEESIFIKVDVSKPENLIEARKKVMNRFGRVDFLIINAGISFLHRMEEISFEEWNNVIMINLNGSFYTMKAFYEEFTTNKGKVIFITSGSAITGTGGGAHYAASKAGQHGLMRTISKELGPKGVNVNAIAPRVIQTDILNTLYPTEESREELVKKIPIGRIGQGEDIANVAVFLASKDSSYIHGQIILADGGRTY